MTWKYSLTQILKLHSILSSLRGSGTEITCNKTLSIFCCCVPILLTTFIPEHQRNVSIAAVLGVVRLSKPIQTLLLILYIIEKY